MTKASVVIPNFNGMNYLEGCLESLERQNCKEFQVILIDNGSTDGSVDYVRKHFPKVRIRAFHRNTGFCRAVNEGIGMNDAPYVILLNNDTVCAPGFVGSLIEAMERHPDCFSGQARMVQLQEPTLLDDAGDFYCALGWAFARGKGKAANRYRREDCIFASCAGAAIYRRTVLEEIGLFDERHFAYLEDIDLGYRANLRGYRSYFVPEAVVEHAGSGSSGSRYNAFKVQHTARNNIYLIYKNMPDWQILLNLPFLLAGFLMKAGFFAGKGFLREYLSGTAQGFRLCTPERRVDFHQAGTARLWRMQGRLLAGVVRRVFAS